MPFTTNPNEVTIYNYLTTTGGLNSAAACGVLVNLYYESGLEPTNLQDTYNRSLGYTDSGYTAAVDNGSYKNFVRDSAGYGLAQWTYWSRKQNLLNFAKSKGTSIGNMAMQLEFLLSELKGYTKTWNSIKSCSNDANGAYQVAYTMCNDFERPAGGETTARNRGNEAKNKVFPSYLGSAQMVSGSSIVSTARSLLGKPYRSGAEGPDYFTSYSFVYYCYKENNVDIPKTALEQAELGQGTYVMSDFQPGDIMFFSGETRRSGQSIVASGIATGVGYKFIGCMGYTDYMEAMEIDAESEELWRDKFVGAVRILNGATGINAGSSYSGYVSNSPTYSLTDLPGTSIPLSATDSYSDNLESALSVLAERGETYSSVINLRTGEEFKFYTNENVSENFPVTYSSPGNILGRSVPVLGYDSTGARTVAISLHLFAGTPYRPDLNTSADVDHVGVLHKDLDLLKSFEYPDYSTSIVIPPPIVLLSIGSSLKIRGVLQGLSIECNRPFDAKNRAMSANVSFTVTQVSENPPDAYDIKNRTNKSY